MLRKLALVLILEIIVGANAGLSFSMFPPYVASLWAGSCFLALGLFILTYLFQWNFKSRSPLFWMAMIHTFVFSIPMLVQRLLTSPNESVVQVLMVVPMAQFHEASKLSYSIMIGATLLEMVLAIVRMRKKSPKI